METTYFVLGVLTVVAVIVAGVITWGLLMINKQQTQILLVDHLLMEYC